MKEIGSFLFVVLLYTIIIYYSNKYFNDSIKPFFEEAELEISLKNIYTTENCHELKEVVSKEKVLLPKYEKVIEEAGKERRLNLFFEDCEFELKEKKIRFLWLIVFLFGLFIRFSYQLNEFINSGVSLQTPINDFLTNKTFLDLILIVVGAKTAYICAYRNKGVGFLIASLIGGALIFLLAIPLYLNKTLVLTPYLVLSSMLLLANFYVDYKLYQMNTIAIARRQLNALKERLGF